MRFSALPLALKNCGCIRTSSTKALVEKLAAGPVTYEAHDYGDFEKADRMPICAKKSRVFTFSYRKI